MVLSKAWQNTVEETEIFKLGQKTSTPEIFLTRYPCDSLRDIMAIKEKVKWTGAMVLLLQDNFQCQDAGRFKRRVLLGSEEEREVGYRVKNYKLMFKDWLRQNNNSNHNVNYSKF